MSTPVRPTSGTLAAVGFLAASITLLLVGAARADHDDHRDRGRGHHDWFHDRDDDGDHGRWWREHHESDRDGHLRGDNTRDCGAIRERIRYDRDQARSIEPGRHQKALQWYKDDIENARNDLRDCRR